jgi:DNA-binding CsgD family transcriptional regulator
MMGAGDFTRGEPDGQATLEHLLELAREKGSIDEMATAYCWLARGASRWRRYREAARYLEAGIEHCARYDLEAWGPYLIALRAENDLALGDWQKAADSASVVLDGDGRGPATVMSLVTVGRLRARRGDSGAWPALDRARELAEGSLELDRLGRVAAARAETAWLEGRDEAAVDETEAAWDLARRQGEPWFFGELAQWRRRAGVADEPPDGAAEPYALALAGDRRAAATLWRALGCPYEAALVEAEGDDEHSRHALQTLHGLGARAAATVIGRRLSERGARRLPRGPRAQTSSNPAQLTDREVEVLGLLAEGLRNAQIAERLVISVRTVDHHVSAILGKLDVTSRGQAAAAASRLGLLPPT